VRRIEGIDMDTIRTRRNVTALFLAGAASNGHLIGRRHQVAGAGNPRAYVTIVMIQRACRPDGTQTIGWQFVDGIVVRNNKPDIIFSPKDFARRRVYLTVACDMHLRNKEGRVSNRCTKMFAKMASDAVGRRIKPDDVALVFDMTR
jgi:hypothetical protein